MLMKDVIIENKELKKENNMLMNLLKESNKILELSSSISTPHQKDACIGLIEDTKQLCETIKTILKEKKC